MIVSFAKESHVYVVRTTEALDLILVSLYPSQRKTELFYANLLQLSVSCELNSLEPICSTPRITQKYNHLKQEHNIQKINYILITCT